VKTARLAAQTVTTTVIAMTSVAAETAIVADATAIVTVAVAEARTSRNQRSQRMTY
jgi:hypothetical protein